VNDQRLAVARELQVLAVALHDVRQRAEHRSHVAPLKVAGDWVLKDGIVGASMGTEQL
jgi:hypothetical protein